MPGKWKNRRDDAGSMLAAVIVIVCGAGVCAFVGALDRSEAGAWMLGGVVLLAALFLWWIIWYRYKSNVGQSGLAFWHIFSRNHRDDGLAAQYRPRKVGDSRSNQPSGTNQPITADEAHEIQATSANTWVPSKNREGGDSA